MEETESARSAASPTGFNEQTPLESLPEKARNQALKQALEILVRNGSLEMGPERISEALGPEQLRLLGESVEFSEQELQVIASGIDPSQIEMENGQNGSTSISSKAAEVVNSTVFDRPQVVLYAISISTMLVGLSFDSFIPIVLGGFLLLITGLHYAD